KYHPRLVSGAEGVTVGATGMWSRGSDRFIGVHFEGIGTFDILWESLQITDEDYLAQAAARQQKRREALKQAKNVVKYLGPRGGFKFLAYEYPDEYGGTTHTSCSNRLEAAKLEKFFREQGIEVSTAVWEMSE